MAALKDMTGERYGLLTVVKRAGRSQNPNWEKRLTTWLCRCDCGGEKIASRPALLGGYTRSCGCLRRKSRSVQP